MADLSPVCGASGSAWYDFADSGADDADPQASPGFGEDSAALVCRVATPPDPPAPAEPPGLEIEQHVFLDVNLLTPASLSRSEMGQLLGSPFGPAPVVAEKLHLSQQATGAKWGVVLQVKQSFGTEIRSLPLVPPALSARGANWAVEAGGVTLESIETSNLTNWWVVDPPNVLWLAADDREKLGLAYANAVYKSELGTVQLGLSSSSQVSYWGTLVATPQRWELSGFASAEVVALKANARYETPMVPVPGTLGLVNLRASVAVDLNLGAAGGVLGAGIRGNHDCSSVQGYVVLGFSPKIGWRGLGIYDLSIDTQKAGRLGQEIDDEYQRDPGIQAAHAALSSGALIGSGVDPTLVAGGLYLGAAWKTVGARVSGELGQFGRDAAQALEQSSRPLRNEIAHEIETDPALEALEAALGDGAAWGATEDLGQARGGLALGAAARVVGRHVGEWVHEVQQLLAAPPQPPSPPSPNEAQ